MVANQTANFVVKAKDAATGPLGKVGGSMGKLKRTAGTAFKAIAGAVADLYADKRGAKKPKK